MFLFSKDYRRGGVSTGAFTLAEVLITLGIIGIVAALTIPTVIDDHQKKVYVTRLQKAISVLNNSTQQMLADQAVDEVEYLGFYSCWSDSAIYNPTAEVRTCLNNYFSKYFKIVKYGKSINDEDFYPYSNVLKFDGSNGRTAAILSMASAYGFLTQDGILYFPYTTLPAGVGAIIDVNGPQAPNQFGRDIFFLDRDNGYYSVHGVDTWNNESSNDYCGDNNPTLGYGCSGRIMEEGWKMNY